MAEHDPVLQNIYSRYGSDENQWSWLLLLKTRCRSLRHGQGFKSMDLNADLILGKKTCPLKENVYCVRTPHPAGNVSGRIAARNNPEKCPLCGLEPDSSDFYEVDSEKKI